MLFITAASGRNRINALGAVDALAKEVTTATNTAFICADTLIAFLKQLRKKYGEKLLSIGLDHARYQHYLAVKDIAAP